MNFKTIKAKSRLGYLGDQAREHMTEEDLKKHAEYVKQLKAEGRYGEVVEFEITLVPNPAFDDPPINIGDSIKTSMLDLSNGVVTKIKNKKNE